MQLMYSSASPYVRKVMIVAHELDLLDRLEKVACATTPMKTSAELALINPIAKVPTLITADGALFDSPVICEYLSSLREGQSMFPANGAARWHALRDQALGDGLMDAALLIRYEAMRAEPLRSAEWINAQQAKMEGALTFLEAHVSALGERVDIGTVTIACALGYLDFRFEEMTWRERCPALARWFAGFAARPSFTSTAP